MGSQHFDLDEWGEERSFDMLFRSQVSMESRKGSDAVMVHLECGEVSIDSIGLCKGHKHLDQFEEDKICHTDVAAEEIFFFT